MVKSRWQSPCNKLSSSKYIQPQCIGDLCTNILRNNIRGQQNAETTDIADDVSSIASVSTKQLVNTRSGYKLSPSSFTVCLPEELIIPTLRLKKWLTNM